MNSIFNLALSSILAITASAFLTSDPSNFATRHFQDPISMSSICNTFDEAHYCKMITLDTALNTVAESHRCECPESFRCPSDTDDTKLETRCHYDNERQWNRCYLRCAPVDL